MENHLTDAQKLDTPKKHETGKKKHRIEASTSTTDLTPVKFLNTASDNQIPEISPFGISNFVESSNIKKHKSSEVQTEEVGIQSEIAAPSEEFKVAIAK